MSVGRDGCVWGGSDECGKGVMGGIIRSRPLRRLD